MGPGGEDEGEALCARVAGWPGSASSTPMPLPISPLSADSFMYMPAREERRTAATTSSVLPHPFKSSYMAASISVVLPLAVRFYYFAHFSFLVGTGIHDCLVSSSFGAAWVCYYMSWLFAPGGASEGLLTSHQ